MEFIISWNAPIIPSQSLAGIPVGIDIEHLDNRLKKYVIDSDKDLYQFEGSPILQLKKSILEGFGIPDPSIRIIYTFFIYNENALFDKYLDVLQIHIDNYKIIAIKALNDFPSSPKYKEYLHYIYQGKLPNNIGLGSFVAELLVYTELEYDDAEEWFYTDQYYGGLEVWGTGCAPLEEYPESKIVGLSVIENPLIIPSDWYVLYFSEPINIEVKLILNKVNEIFNLFLCQENYKVNYDFFSLNKNFSSSLNDFNEVNIVQSKNIYNVVGLGRLNELDSFEIQYDICRSPLDCAIDNIQYCIILRGAKREHDLYKSLVQLFFSVAIAEIIGNSFIYDTNGAMSTINSNKDSKKIKIMDIYEKKLLTALPLDNAIDTFCKKIGFIPY